MARRREKGRARGRKKEGNFAGISGGDAARFKEGKNPGGGRPEIAERPAATSSIWKVRREG
jgi:hypothetical protein